MFFGISLQQKDLRCDWPCLPTLGAFAESPMCEHFYPEVENLFGAEFNPN
jgi:hypothetical protein